MKNATRIPVTWMVLLGLLGVVFACSGDSPIKLGFVAGLTGRVADLGVAGRNGVMLALEQKNISGGIKGHPIELIVRDDQQEAEVAKKVVSELIGLKVAAIIGPMTSSMAMVTVPLANASRIAMVSPTVTTTSLQAKDDYFIRVISTTADYASKIARYQFQKLGNRTAAVIYDLSNKAYTESWYSDFRDTFEGLGGRIVKSHTYTSNDEAVFFESVKGLLNVAPDVLVIISNSVDAALICQQVQKIDPRMSLALAEWASTERLTELGGSATEGASVSQFLDRNDTSAPYQEFRERYLDRFGQEPGFAGMAGYDAALVVLDALQNLEDGQALNKAIIDKGIFQGVQQSIIIDRFGDADRKVFVTTIRDGRYVTIE